MGFTNILVDTEIYTIPKTWKKYRKTQTFQIYGFLEYFG